jgi:hypothetical protein
MSTLTWLNSERILSSVKIRRFSSRPRRTRFWNVSLEFRITSPHLLKSIILQASCAPEGSCARYTWPNWPLPRSRWVIAYWSSKHYIIFSRGGSMGHNRSYLNVPNLIRILWTLVWLMKFPKTECPVRLNLYCITMIEKKCPPRTATYTDALVVDISSIRGFEIFTIDKRWNLPFIFIIKYRVDAEVAFWNPKVWDDPMAVWSQLLELELERRNSPFVRVLSAYHKFFPGKNG